MPIVTSPVTGKTIPEVRQTCDRFTPPSYATKTANCTFPNCQLPDFKGMCKSEAARK